MSYKLNRVDVDYFIMIWFFLYYRVFKCVVFDVLFFVIVSVLKGRSIMNEKVRRLIFIWFKYDFNILNF